MEEKSKMKKKKKKRKNRERLCVSFCGVVACVWLSIHNHQRHQERKMKTRTMRG